MFRSLTQGERPVDSTNWMFKDRLPGTPVGSSSIIVRACERMEGKVRLNDKN